MAQPGVVPWHIVGRPVVAAVVAGRQRSIARPVVVPSPLWVVRAVFHLHAVRPASQGRGMVPAKVGFGREAARCPLRHQVGRWGQGLAEDYPPQLLFVVVGADKRLAGPTDFGLGPSHLYRERTVQRYLKRKNNTNKRLFLFKIIYMHNMHMLALVKKS